MIERSSGTGQRSKALPQIIRPRLFLGTELLIGPGKIDLLRAVQATGSISAAARASGMGYKRAWTLLDEIRQACGTEVIASSAGGSGGGGGGATLTALGRALLAHYEAIEAACAAASAPHLKRLGRLLKHTDR